VEVSHRAVRVYSGEGEVAWKVSLEMGCGGEDERERAPTLAVVSVKLLSVVLLPDEGLPTRPINGSRGIVFVSFDHVRSLVRSGDLPSSCRRPAQVVCVSKDPPQAVIRFCFFVPQ